MNPTLLILALFPGRPAWADSAEFLSASSSPSASVLLGSSTTDVDHPTTVSTLSASVTDTVSESSGIPDDYAIEIAPFWLFPRDLRLDDYLAGGPRILTDNLTVSLATVETDDDGVEAAMGLHTALVWGNRDALRDDIDGCISSLQAATRSKAEWIADYVASHTDEDDLQQVLDNAQDAWEEAEEDLQEEAEDLHDTCMDLLEQRRGFAMDLSLAGSLAFPDQNVALLTPGRAGVWLSPAWLQEKWSLVGNVGWIAEDLTQDDPDPYGKIGGKLVLMSSKISLAPEAVYQYHYLDTDQPHQGQAALGINLKLGSNLWVSASLGTEFPLDTSNSLVNQLAITYDSGTERTLSPASTPESDNES